MSEVLTAAPVPQMSLLDHFASICLQNSGDVTKPHIKRTDSEQDREIATRCYHRAEAMMTERRNRLNKAKEIIENVEL